MVEEEQGDLSMPLVSSDNTATRDDTHGIPILCTFFCALRDSRGDCWEDGGADCKVRNKWGQRSLRKTVTTEQNLDYCRHRSFFFFLLLFFFFSFFFFLSSVHFPPRLSVVIFPPLYSARKIACCHRFLVVVCDLFLLLLYPSCSSSDTFSGAAGYSLSPLLWSERHRPRMRMG